jgi:subtilase family serine protease
VTLYGNCQDVGIPPIPPTPTRIIVPTWTPPIPTSTLTLTPQATATAGLPDLVVTNLSLVGGTTLQLEPGNTPVSGTFSVTITNTGQSATTQFNNVINVNPPGTDTQLGVVASLAPGESIVLNISLTFTVSGSYTIQVRADSDSQLTEVSKVNNNALMSLTVTDNP